MTTRDPRVRTRRPSPRLRDGVGLVVLLVVLVIGAGASALRRSAVARASSRARHAPVLRDDLLLAESVAALGWERVLDILAGPDRALAGEELGRVELSMDGVRARLDAAGLVAGEHLRLDVTRAGLRRGIARPTAAETLVRRSDLADGRVLLHLTVTVPSTSAARCALVLGRSWILSTLAERRGVDARLTVQHAYVSGPPERLAPR